MKRNVVILKAAAVLMMGSAAAMALGQAQTKVPDAQVESNVLRALAGAPELANQNISTSTVYGTVTLSGSVTDEASRVKAETLASRADGVVKVVDELTVGAAVQAEGSVQERQEEQQQQETPARQEQEQMQQQAPQGQRGYPQQQYPQYPQQSQQNYPQQGNGPYGPPPAPPLQRRTPYGGQQYPNQYPQQQYPQQQYPQHGQGQAGGQTVTLPVGTVINVRLIQGLDTKHTVTGGSFDATVANDVIAGHSIAIPRGATVQGTIVKVEAAGALKGKGEISLQLTGVTMGGEHFALTTDTWERGTHDKSVRSVDKVVGGGVIGALVGAAVGGGPGAAVGAVVGGGIGAASAASTPTGQIWLAPETVLTFHLTQEVAVTTISQDEMNRMAYGQQRSYPSYPSRGPYGAYPPPPPPPPPYGGGVYYPEYYYGGGYPVVVGGYYGGRRYYGGRGYYRY